MFVNRIINNKKKKKKHTHTHTIALVYTSLEVYSSISTLNSKEWKIQWLLGSIEKIDIAIYTESENHLFSSIRVKFQTVKSEFSIFLEWNFQFFTKCFLSTIPVEWVSFMFQSREIVLREHSVKDWKFHSKNIEIVLFAE